MFKQRKYKMTKDADKILLLDAKLVNAPWGSKNTTLGGYLSSNRSTCISTGQTNQNNQTNQTNYTLNQTFYKLAF